MHFSIGIVPNANDAYATYVSGSGTNTLTFSYTVLATDADSDGIYQYTNRPSSVTSPFRSRCLRIGPAVSWPRRTAASTKLTQSPCRWNLPSSW